MSRQSQKAQERQEAIERLREILKPGDTVYTIIRHVSRSGMQRSIQLLKFPIVEQGPCKVDGCGEPSCHHLHSPSEECEGCAAPRDHHAYQGEQTVGRPFYLGRLAATALGWTYDDKNEGVKVNGCGMDMAFHTVYSLSSVLFRDLPGEAYRDRTDAGYWLSKESL